MKSDYARLPPTLQQFIIRGCMFSENILHGSFPCLQDVEINSCKIPDSLSFHHLNSLQSLRFINCSSLRLIKLCPIIGTLFLVSLPNLDEQSVLESWQDCRQLHISSSMMLNTLLLSDNFVAPEVLVMDYCQEEETSFENSVHLQSIKTLVFKKCRTKCLPKTLSDFSTLDYIVFSDCPEISGLPELPRSVQVIQITGCPVLKERCQTNGQDWHKIRHIKNRWIE